MKLFLVTADTYKENEYGSLINLFGIFSEKEDAEKRKASLEENYQYDVSVNEVSLDENCEIYLGGCIE